MQKRLLIPSRVRRVPRQFSWVDQRLVRDRHLERCNVSAWALYLFLVTVADARGLSYYADDSICRLLSLEGRRLIQSRQALIDVELIAYEVPLYQVLALEPSAALAAGPVPPAPTAPVSPRSSTPACSAAGLRSIREVLRQAMEGGP